MKKWEDIVKDMMEEPEGALPESVFAEFRARRTAGGAIPRKKTRPLVWVMAAAVAAGFAAVLLLRKPTTPEDGIRLIQQPSVVKVQVDETSDIVPPVTPTPLIAQATSPRVVRRPVTLEPEEIIPSAVQEETVPVIEPEEPVVPETEEVVTEDTPFERNVDKPVIADSAPFVHQSSRDKAVKVNVVPGAIAAGGGLAAALATQLAGANAFDPNQVIDIDGPHNTSDTGGYSHRVPVIVGLSARIPVTEKLGITTSLEYSLYTSQITYPFTVQERTQHVHYLGIPVRLDWSFISGRWFEAYVGAGVKGDFCMDAKLDKMNLGKDGPAFRLLGAGGIQFNATRNLSLFVEPEISWTVPSERRVLSTYSSEHPWMFTVATGVRINLGK
jgi:hypothetical protein